MNKHELPAFCLQFDAMGNLLSMTLGATSRSFTYQTPTPRLSTVTESGMGTRTIGYDMVGNELSVQGATYTYSSRNLLASANGATGAMVRRRVGSLGVKPLGLDPATSYTYDGRGIRVKLSQTNGSTTQERSFIYDDQMRLVAETTYQTPPSTAIAYEYIWFGGQPVAQETIGGSTAWTMTDHLGTPVVQTNLSGTVLWRVEYEPYGEVFSLRSGSDRHQPLPLPGQEAEQLDLGLNGDSERSYNLFRWYRPKWGRYTQLDKNLRPRPEEPNPFGYVADRPVVARDPFGLNIVYNASCQPILVKPEEGSEVVVVPVGGAAYADGFYNRTPSLCGKFCDSGPGDQVRKINDLTDVVITGGCDGKCLDWEYADPGSALADMLDPRTGWKGDDWFAKHPDWPRPNTPPNWTCCKQ